MAKKSTKPPEPAPRKADLHTGAPFTMRLPTKMLAVLDELADRSDRSRTGEIRLAIRKHLEAAGLWPPADHSADDDGSEDSDGGD